MSDPDNSPQGREPLAIFNRLVAQIGYERLRCWDCSMTLLKVVEVDPKIEPELFRLHDNPARLWQAIYHAQDTALGMPRYHMCYLSAYVSSRDLATQAPYTGGEEQP